MSGALRDRVAIVTGAARGIGLAAAQALLSEGARVLICDIDDDALAEAARDLGAHGEVLVQRCDVSRAAAVDAMVVAAVTRWGGLDILVSNAAISDDTPIEELSDARWRDVLAINLDSVLYCARSALPH